MSSFQHSVLGLCESPRTMAAPSTPGSLSASRSRTNLRGTRPLQPNAETLKQSGDSRSLGPKSRRKAPPQLTDDWESMLVQNANRLHLETPLQPREEQRQKDAEWEQRGMWKAQQDAARAAEDRTRREMGRDIGEPVSKIADHSLPTRSPARPNPSRCLWCHFCACWLAASAPSFNIRNLHLSKSARLVSFPSIIFFSSSHT